MEKKDKTFHERLLDFQTNISAIKKGKENPFHKSKYADINLFLAEVKPALTNAGLTLTQPITSDEHGMLLRTIVSDGTNTLESSIPVPATQKIQDLGATITYLRRYSLQSLLSLEAEDDDGESVKDIKPVAKPTPKPTPKELPLVKIIENAITKTNTIDGLVQLGTDTAESKKLTEEDKSFLTTAINIKIDQLQAKENGA